MRGFLSWLLEDIVFDASMIDLVLWFPHLGWIEFAGCVLAVCVWNFIADRIVNAIKWAILDAVGPRLGRYRFALRYLR